MPSPRPALAHALLVVLTVAAAAASAQTVDQAPFTRVLARDGVGDMMSATRNKEFLAATLKGEDVSALRGFLGKDVADRIAGLAQAEGKSIRELIEKNPDLAKQYPQVLGFLAAREKPYGVKLYGSDREPNAIDVTSPGRVIPPADLARVFGSGGEAGADRLRDYLKSNFGMDDAQVKAYQAFLAAAGSDGNVGDPATAGKGALEGLKLPDATRDGKGGGLYLPSGDVLGKIARLQAFLEKFGSEGNTDASSFRGPDGASLGDLIAELDPENKSKFSLDDLRRMSPGAVREQIAQLMGKVTKAELEGPNRYLLETGVAWTQGGDDSAKKKEKSPRGKRARKAIGNGRIRELNEALYRTLILEDLKPSQRDRAELESDGEVFSIRGRPGDIQQKHYDPPMDTEGLLFGIGMSLQNKRDK